MKEKCVGYVHANKYQGNIHYFDDTLPIPLIGSVHQSL